LAGNNWSSQVRIYSPALHEISLNNDPAYITVNQAALTTVVSAYPFTAFTRIGVSQEDNNDFNGTEVWDYNVAAPNSGLTGDEEKPVLTKAEAGEQVGSSLPVSCEASDNSGDYFYLVTDEANNFSFASFNDNFSVTLAPATNYSLRVVAVDFSGNESDPILITIGEKPFESVLEGIARGIDFELGSTTSSLQVRAKPVDGSATFTNFKIQIGDENTVFSENTPTPYEVVLENWAGIPTISYTITNSPIFNTAKDGIVYLNFIYILGPNVDPEGNQQAWDDLYGKTTTTATLTAGPRSGERIAIKLGDGVIREGAGLNELNMVNTSIAQTGEAIFIQSPETIQSVRLYSVNGQLVDSRVSATISTTRYSEGVYILKVRDSKGNVDTFKVVVK
jgi:hypothetical protein